MFFLQKSLAFLYASASEGGTLVYSPSMNSSLSLQFYRWKEVNSVLSSVKSEVPSIPGVSAFKKTCFEYMSSVLFCTRGDI